jgi:hypothetical protein
MYEFTIYTRKNSITKRLKRGVRVLFGKERKLEINIIESGVETCIASYKNKKVITIITANIDKVFEKKVA